MRRIHIKRSRRGLLGVSILVLVICGVFFINTQVLDAKVNSRKEQITALEKNKKSLEQKQVDLKNDLELTEQDIVEIARQKLNLAFPDDLVIKAKN